LETDRIFLTIKSQIGSSFSYFRRLQSLFVANLQVVDPFFIPVNFGIQIGSKRLIMVKVLLLTITILAGANVIVCGQGKSVIIGTMIDRPNAILVINPPNGDQGFLLPQLTSSQRLSMSPVSPEDDGLMVFDLTEESFYYWSSKTWIKGLGDNSRVLSYDPTTQKLALSGGGGEVDLNTLKEIPATTGNAGKFLTTDGTTLSWANIGALGDISSIITGQGLSGGVASGDVNLSVNTDGTTISVNGSNQLQLSNGAVTTPKIAANAVNSSHIIDGSVTSADILDNTISSNDLANASVTGPKIVSGAVNTTHITPGGNNKVLTTDGTGTVIWSDRSSFTDDNQNLSFSGNTLSIDNGTGVNLSANGQVTGLLDNLTIQPGTSNQALVTNAAGTAAVWATPGGDVTGAVSATTVGKIQGRDVSSAAPNTGDALIWNGAASAWEPTVVTVAPTTQYYAVDPANFEGLEPTGGTNETVLGLYQADNTFVTDNGSGRQIMAPVNLPHGATIQTVTVYCEDNVLVLDNMTISLNRKNFNGGANEVLTTATTSILAIGLQAMVLPAVPVVSRVIDNATYSYRIHVIFSHLLDVVNPAAATQKIYGIRIEYTK